MAKYGSTNIYIELKPSAREVKRSLRKADKTIKRELRQKLKEVGTIVATEAQKLAREKGLVDTGRLVRSIKPTASQTSAKIRATAKRRSRKYPRGYNYPRRYEFQEKGRRAFMRPALKNKEEEVVKKFKEVLEQAVKEIIK